MLSSWFFYIKTSHNHDYNRITPNGDDFGFYGGGGNGGWGIYLQTPNNDNYGRFGIGYNGGSQPHNNIPPYLAVFIWKRTS